MTTARQQAVVGQMTKAAHGPREMAPKGELTMMQPLATNAAANFGRPIHSDVGRPMSILRPSAAMAMEALIQIAALDPTVLSHPDIVPMDLQK